MFLSYNRQKMPFVANIEFIPKKNSPLDVVIIGLIGNKFNGSLKA